MAAWDKYITGTKGVKLLKKNFTYFNDFYCCLKATAGRANHYDIVCYTPEVEAFMQEHSFEKNPNLYFQKDLTKVSS